MKNENLIVLYDTREKQIFIIIQQLRMMGIRTERRKLDTGDYSFIYGGIDYTKQFAIERKANWSELYGNLTKGHARFSREFKRALDINYFVLMVEDPRGIEGIEFIKKHSYKMDIRKFKRTYITFIQLRQSDRKRAEKPPIRLIYTHKADSAKTIVTEIENFLKSVR